MIDNLEKEVWKDIEGYESLYKVSNFGRIKNRKDKILQNIKSNKQLENSYEQISLSKKNIIANNLIHRLVAKHFIPIPEHLKDIPIEELQVNHKDENKTNNCADNLEWCTAQYNNTYGTKIERISKIVYQYDLDGNFIREWKSTREIERELKISHSAISECCNNKTHHNTVYGYLWKYKKDVEG